MLRATLLWTLAITAMSVHGAPYSCLREDVDAEIIALTCYGVDLDTLDDFLSEMDAVVQSGDVQLKLELRESAITDLPSDFLSTYPIRSLTFFNDSLTTIPKDVLSNVQSGLVVLDLSLNSIEQFQDGVLDALPFADTLQILVVTQNAITNLPGGNPFGAFPQLQKLRLQLNRIQNLPEGAFADLQALIELQLYGNEIATVASDAFGNLPALQKLYLNENQIQFLDNDTLTDDKVPALKRIYLGNNPFYCNCTLDWLKVWLKDRNLMFGSDATCEYPIKQPFTMTIFCPSDNADLDRMQAQIAYQRYLQYAVGVIVQDRRDREYRLTHQIR